MGRKKALRKKKNNKENVRDLSTPISSESQDEDVSHHDLKALDFLNILIREQLKEMLTEYEHISLKHNLDINIHWSLSSCSDLKKEEMSRLDRLKSLYFTIWNDKPEKAEVKRRKKGKRKTSLHKDVKDVDTYPVPSEVLKKIENFHIFNIDCFISTHLYAIVGFNKFRYDQCPNVKSDKSLLETGVTDCLLQETMLSLKITEEGMIEEDIKEEDIRILSFGIIEEDVSVRLYFNIPEIKNYDINKIIQNSSETGVFIFVENHKGKNYIFEISNFAYKIRPETVKLDFFDDLVMIRANKKKREKWRELFSYKRQIKELWEEEMKSVLNSLELTVENLLDFLDNTWNITLVLVNCHADLLNLPRDLNHVNQHFETFEEMIIYYKTMIRFTPLQRALFYNLGGALYSMLLMKSNSNSSFKKLLKEKALCKYEEETVKKIANIYEKQQKFFKEGYRLYYDSKYEEANKYFDKALNICPEPNIHALRGFSLLASGRYREAIIDSIFALRNLGPFYGALPLITILEYKIRCGNVINAIVCAISLEYYYNKRKTMHESRIESLKNLRSNGLCILNNIFKCYTLVFQKKYKYAIPFLEKAEEKITIKSGHTSVILLLLYFISKNYEKVITLGEVILGNYICYKDLVYYLLGMSSYYMKKLGAAISYLEKIKNINLEELTKIRTLKYFIDKADDFIRSGKLKDLKKGGQIKIADLFVGYYKNAMPLAKDNDQLLSHIWNKLGVFNMFSGNFEEAVRCLTCSADLVDDNKNILLLRSEAYNKLVMENKAKEVHEDAIRCV